MHLNLDEIADELSMKDSAKMASHTSTKTTKEYYTFNEDRRQSERLKNVNNDFAWCFMSNKFWNNLIKINSFFNYTGIN